MGRTERQNSILTKEQRQTLLGTSNEDREGSGKRNFETAIRKRIRNGLIDFQTLNKGLKRGDVGGNGEITTDDLRTIFDSRLVDRDHEPPELPAPDFDRAAMPYIAVTHLVAFGYRGLRATGNGPDSVMRNAIMRGVLMGEADHRGVDHSLVGIDWDFELTVDERSEAEPLEKWKQDLAMTGEERNKLHEQLIEAVPEEVYQEATPMDFDDLVAEYLVSEG